MESEFSGPDLIDDFSGQEFSGPSKSNRRQYPYEDEEGVIWIDHLGFFDHYPSTCYVCGCITRRFDIILQTHYCNSETCYYEAKAMSLAEGIKREGERGGRHKRAG